MISILYVYNNLTVTHCNFRCMLNTHMCYFCRLYNDISHCVACRPLINGRSSLLSNNNFDWLYIYMYIYIILFQTIYIHVQCVHRVIMKKQGVAVHVRSTYYTTVMSIGYGGPTSEPGRSTLNVLNYKYFPPEKYLSTSTFWGNVVKYIPSTFKMYLITIMSTFQLPSNCLYPDNQTFLT